MDLKEQTIETYNRSADALAEKFDGIRSRKLDIDRLFGLIGFENPRIFEIGCANGKDAELILQKTDRYVGLDVSESLVAIARKRHPGVEFVVQDIESYVFDREFDAVYAAASLIHVPREKLVDVLRKIRNALSEGGILYVSMKRDEYREYTKTDQFGTRTYYYYIPDLFVELAGEGFKEEYRDEQFFQEQDWFTLALRKI